MHSQIQKTGLASWQKWALMTVIVGGLSGIVIYFNYRVFGTFDGLPYSAVVAFLSLLSFIVTLHIKRGAATTNFLCAAFIFEVLLCIALGVNAAYSLAVMRGMSVAGAMETQRQADLASVSRLKGQRTQRDALRLLADAGSAKTRQQVFAENERVLFWILILELSVGLVATFTLLGLSVFDRDKDVVPDVFQTSVNSLPRGSGEIAQADPVFQPVVAESGLAELSLDQAPKSPAPAVVGVTAPAPNRSSARVALPSPSAKFELRAKPKPERSVEAKLGSGAGTNLPQMKNLQWELNRRGGWEAWHAPDGATERIHKTYLGYVGKRKLAAWLRDHTGEDLRAVIEQWIVERRAEKGLA